MTSDSARRQCRVSKKLGGGMLRMTAWVPSVRASVGNVVRIQEWGRDAWQDGWQIDEICKGQGRR